MAFYNSGALFDNGVRYDEGQYKQQIPKMDQIKLNLKSKSDADLVQYVDTHTAALAKYQTENVDLKDPDPTDVELKAARDAFNAALVNSNAAQKTASELVVIKDNARVVLERLMTNRGSWIQRKTGGAKEKILAVAMAVRSVRGHATAPLKVANVSITGGDNPGHVDFQWDGQSDADRFEGQLATDATFTAGVVNLPSVTKSKTEANGLASGSRIYGRVRALNAAGPGPWSEAATKIVP